MPVRRWIARCESPSTCFISLICAHCSTSSNAFLRSRSLDRARSRVRSDASDPASEWTSFRPAQVVQYSGGAYSSIDISRREKEIDAAARIRGVAVAQVARLREGGKGTSHQFERKPATDLACAPALHSRHALCFFLLIRRPPRVLP